MTGRKFYGVSEEGRRETAVGCETCIQRKTCERAADGTFCGQWRSKEPEEKDETEDPNWKWEHGEEAEF